MNIVVLVKTVRFLQAQTGSNPKENYIGPGDLVDMMNPFDEAALEEALRIKDEQRETEIAVLSLGGPSAETGLRRSLAMGADRATHILCDGHEGMDSLATARALAAALRREQTPLILCGSEAIDDNAGLVGPYVAECLNVPHVAHVVKVELSDGTIHVERRLDRGDRALIECTAPALLTVERDINVARMPTMPAMMQARKVVIETLTLEELTPTDTQLGPAASLTKTTRLSNPKAKRRSEKQLNPTISPAERMKLMMKGGGAPAKEASSLMEGDASNVLQAFERVMHSCGVSVRDTPSD